jgi:hypothetical protein
MFTMLGSEEGQAKGLPLERKKEEEKESKLQVESTPLSVQLSVRRYSKYLINSNTLVFTGLYTFIHHASTKGIQLNSPTRIMSASEDDIVDEFFKTIGTIQSMKDSLDNAYYNGIKEILNKANEELTVHTGEYLHHLKNNKPDKETLQKMIAVVPLALSHTNFRGQLPIHSAAWSRYSVEYVPLLAKEGITHQVGGHDNRGGLLVVDPRTNRRKNVLQLLANMENDTNPVAYDTAYRKTMMELRQSNLLLKEDIQEFDLLYHACGPGSQLRFDYFADWDAQGLKNHQHGGLPIIHALIKGWAIEQFKVFFKAALKHYPENIGLLFQKDNDGKTACERALNKYGKDKTMKAIGECIPLDDPKLPILHHVMKLAPQFMNGFGNRYPSAAFLRDNQGRTLQQATLASGTKTYKDNVMFFLGMSDEQVKKRDPGTDLYPFMVLASSGHTSDLSAVYYLLKRKPFLIFGDESEERSLSNDQDESVPKDDGRKRKRG